MIDVTINDNPKAEKPFPKVMQATKAVNTAIGTLVLFLNPCEGYVIKGSSKYVVGYYSQDFKMEHFTDYDFDQPAKLDAEFPKLMISDLGQIFWMIKVNEQRDDLLVGFEIYHNGYSIGGVGFSKNMRRDIFTDFHGSITLKNKKP